MLNSLFKKVLRGVGEGDSYITIEDPDQDPPSLIITTNSFPGSFVMSFN